MSYRCGPADWIDLAVGRLEDAKRSLRECDRLRQGCDICDELRQARRCLDKALIMVAEDLACPSSEEPTHAYNVVSGMCDACADRCGGTLCQSMALHNICNRIHSLLAGDGE